MWNGPSVARSGTGEPSVAEWNRCSEGRSAFLARAACFARAFVSSITCFVLMNAVASRGSANCSFGLYRYVDLSARSYRDSRQQSSEVLKPSTYDHALGRDYILADILAVV